MSGLHVPAQELCLSLQPGHYSSSKHVEPIRSTIKYQVASSWFFDSSVSTVIYSEQRLRGL